LLAARLRIDEPSRRGLYRKEKDREREGNDRIRNVRRRRTRRCAVYGETFRFFRRAGGNSAADAGHRASVRAARRKEKPEPRAHQVSGSGYGNREIQGTGSGRTEDIAARSALDELHR